MPFVGAILVKLCTVNQCIKEKKRDLYYLHVDRDDISCANFQFEHNLKLPLLGFPRASL